MNGKVVSVSKSEAHDFSKRSLAEIHLQTGLGVVGDAHFGETVKHRSRVARDPTQPNLRQVHLIHSELFSELSKRGFRVLPGDLGENVTTLGLPILDLPTDTELQLGSEARIRLTGLRNPCRQIDNFAPGLMSAVLDEGADGILHRKAGVMAIVIQGGIVRPGDKIEVILPQGTVQPLRPV